MSSPFVAEIKMFAGSFAPTGYALCNGQLMPISQNTALFSLLGTNYGGDGRVTFGLPNLQATAPVNQGTSSASGSDYFIGQSSGVPYVTLLTSEMPLHNHAAKAYTGDPADTRTPSPSVSLGYPSPGNLYNSSNFGIAQANPQALSLTGGSQPHNNMMPYLAVTFIIALQGIFPARS